MLILTYILPLAVARVDNKLKTLSYDNKYGVGSACACAGRHTKILIVIVIIIIITNRKLHCVVQLFVHLSFSSLYIDSHHGPNISVFRLVVHTKHDFGFIRI